MEGYEVAKDTIAYMTEITAPDVEAREGYTFGWKDEIPDKMPAKDVTVNGAYDVNYYTITYIVDGEDYKVVEVAYGESIIAIEAPVKEGYDFSGWSEIPATMPAKDITIFGTFIHTNITGVSSDATVKVNGSCITLNGANNCSIAIYSANGTLVEKIDSYTGEEIVLDKGIYIVSVRNKTIKVKL